MFLFSGGQTWVSAHVSVLFCNAVIEPQNRRHWWYFCFLIINMSCIPPSSADQRGLSQTPGARSIIQAAIFIVLSIWHATKIWALSKAEDAISQPRKQFYFILLYRQLPLLTLLSSAVNPLLHLTLSFPPIRFLLSFNQNSHYYFVSVCYAIP